MNYIGTSDKGDDRMMQIPLEVFLILVALVICITIFFMLDIYSEIDNLKFKNDLLKSEVEMYKERREKQQFEEQLVKKYGLKEIEQTNKFIKTSYGLATMDNNGFYVLPTGEKLYKVIADDLKEE